MALYASQLSTRTACGYSERFTLSDQAHFTFVICQIDLQDAAAQC